MQQTSVFNGYTNRQEKAIMQALRDVGLKAGADSDRILFDISTLVVDVCEGHSHADSRMSMAEVEKRYPGLIKAYEKLGERLQWDLDDALGCRLSDVVKWRISAFKGETANNQVAPTWGEWAALVEKEMGQHIDLSVDRFTKSQSLPPFNVQELGRPKNHVMRLLVRDLMDIFEKATGIEPVIYHSEHSDSEQYAGNFYKFAVACLAPAFPDSASQLGSAIRTACRQR